MFFFCPGSLQNIILLYNIWFYYYISYYYYTVYLHDILVLGSIICWHSVVQSLTQAWHDNTLHYTGHPCIYCNVIDCSAEHFNRVHNNALGWTEIYCIVLHWAAMNFSVMGPDLEKYNFLTQPRFEPKYIYLEKLRKSF